MILDPSKTFRKNLNKLPIAKRKQVVKALRLFSENTRHQSLNFEQVGDKKQNLYTVRINQADRILLLCIIQNHHYIIIDVGTHDYIYRKVDSMK